MGWYGGAGWGWGGWLGMGMVMVVFWGLLIAGAVALVRVLGRDRVPGRSTSTSSAQQILDERFARGEIDEQEYLQRRNQLDRQ